MHDEIFWNRKAGFFRKTNKAGGIEGGMSNGEHIVLRAAMKPIPTLMKPLRSVDMATKKPFKASIERSDVCAVPAAGVVAEAVVAFEIASAMIEKFGGDSIDEMKRNYRAYEKHLRTGWELEEDAGEEVVRVTGVRSRVRRTIREIDVEMRFRQ